MFIINLTLKLIKILVDYSTPYIKTYVIPFVKIYVIPYLNKKYNKINYKINKFKKTKVFLNLLFIINFIYAELVMLYKFSFFMYFNFFRKKLKYIKKRMFAFFKQYPLLEKKFNLLLNFFSNNIVIYNFLKCVFNLYYFKKKDWLFFLWNFFIFCLDILDIYFFKPGRKYRRKMYGWKSRYITKKPVGYKQHIFMFLLKHVLTLRNLGFFCHFLFYYYCFLMIQIL